MEGLLVFLLSQFHSQRLTQDIVPLSYSRRRDWLVAFLGLRLSEILPGSLHSLCQATRYYISILFRV